MLEEREREGGREGGKSVIICINLCLFSASWVGVLGAYGWMIRSALGRTEGLFGCTALPRGVTRCLRLSWLPRLAACMQQRPVLLFNLNGTRGAPRRHSSPSPVRPFKTGSSQPILPWAGRHLACRP